MELSSDIRLSSDQQLTAATDGDAPVISGIDALLQDLQMEAITEPGELFYDETYGWGLKEFIQNDDPESCEIEIRERIKEKIARREEIDILSLKITIEFNENITIQIQFSLIGSDKDLSLSLELNRVQVEVIAYD